MSVKEHAVCCAYCGEKSICVLAYLLSTLNSKCNKTYFIIRTDKRAKALL